MLLLENVIRLEMFYLEKLFLIMADNSVAPIFLFTKAIYDYG